MNEKHNRDILTIIKIEEEKKIIFVSWYGDGEEEEEMERVSVGWEGEEEGLEVG